MWWRMGGSLPSHGPMTSSSVDEISAFASGMKSPRAYGPCERANSLGRRNGEGEQQVEKGCRVQPA
jgi:hypothetical protein